MVGEAAVCACAPGSETSAIRNDSAASSFMGREYSGALGRFARAGGASARARGRHGRGRGAPFGQEFLREFRALGGIVGLHRYAELQRAFEAVVTVGVLHQPYDRTRIHLV